MDFRTYTSNQLDPCIKSALVVRELLAASGRCPYMSVCCTATTLACAALTQQQKLYHGADLVSTSLHANARRPSPPPAFAARRCPRCWLADPTASHAAAHAPYRQTLFPDPQAVSTFGFRGEALSSLSALAELSIVTRTEEQGAAARLTYDREGALTGQAAVARAPGTTVAVRDLFNALPVRRRVGQ